MIQHFGDKANMFRTSIVLFVLVTHVTYNHPCDGQKLESKQDSLQNLPLNGQAGQLINVMTKAMGSQNFGISCQVCRLMVGLLQRFLETGSAKDQIADIVAKGCVEFKIQENSICQSIVLLYKDQVAYIVAQLLLSPDTACSMVANDCGAATNLRSPWYTWSVPLPNKRKPPVAKFGNPRAGSPTMRILQITDIHYDLLYQEGSEADCKDFLCCHADSNLKTPNQIRQPAGFWGTLAVCEVPYRTMDAILAYIVKHEQFDAIYWTGDLVPHDFWAQTRESQLALHENVTALFKKYFKNKPVFSAVGNHESVPVNHFPPNSPALPDQYSNQWLYSALKKSWLNWLPKDTGDQILKTASYSTLLNKHLRVISLNTNYFDNYNIWLLLNQTDPDGVMTWLVNELQKAEDAGEKVHVLMHEPPKGSAHFWSWMGLYYDIVNRYESTISGQFSGHEHSDSFRVFWEDSDPSKRLTGAIFVSPSITTFKNHHPTYRIYTVDARPKESWGVLDYETKLINITEANKDTTKLVEPKLEYSFKDTYKVKSLLPSQLERLMHKMNTPRGRKFVESYAKYKKWSMPQNCDVDCLHEHFCDIMIAKPRDPKLCPDWPDASNENLGKIGFVDKEFIGKIVRWFLEKVMMNLGK